MHFQEIQYFLCEIVAFGKLFLEFERTQFQSEYSTPFITAIYLFAAWAKPGPTLQIMLLLSKSLS